VVPTNAPYEAFHPGSTNEAFLLRSNAAASATFGRDFTGSNAAAFAEPGKAFHPESRGSQHTSQQQPGKHLNPNVQSFHPTQSPITDNNNQTVVIYPQEATQWSEDTKSKYAWFVQELKRDPKSFDPNYKTPEAEAKRTEEYLKREARRQAKKEKKHVKQKPVVYNQIDEAQHNLVKQVDRALGKQNRKQPVKTEIQHYNDHFNKKNNSPHSSTEQSTQIKVVDSWAEYDDENIEPAYITKHTHKFMLSASTDISDEYLELSDQSDTEHQPSTSSLTVNVIELEALRKKRMQADEDDIDPEVIAMSIRQDEEETLSRQLNDIAIEESITLHSQQNTKQSLEEKVPSTYSNSHRQKKSSKVSNSVPSKAHKKKPSMAHSMVTSIIHTDDVHINNFNTIGGNSNETIKSMDKRAKKIKDLENRITRTLAKVNCCKHNARINKSRIDEFEQMIKSDPNNDELKKLKSIEEGVLASGIVDYQLLMVKGRKAQIMLNNLIGKYTTQLTLEG
jgi:hypothetical protein